MKLRLIPLIVLTCLFTLLSSCSQAHAGWFGWGDAERLRQQREEEQRRRLSEAEEQLSAHRSSLQTWQLVAGSAAVGALFLLIIGTTLGSHTRHAAARTES